MNCIQLVTFLLVLLLLIVRISSTRNDWKDAEGFWKVLNYNQDEVYPVLDYNVSRTHPVEHVIIDEILDPNSIDKLSPTVENFPIDSSNEMIQCFKNLIKNEECERLMKLPEKVRFRNSKDLCFRNNARIVCYALSNNELLWDRLRGSIATVTIDENHPLARYDATYVGTWVPVGLNPCWRYLHYEPSQFFSPHEDGYFLTRSNVTSLLSVCLYLNEPEEGGELMIFPTRCETVAAEEGTVNSAGNDNILKFKPTPGSAVVFPHHLVHASNTLSKGSKHVIRSDVFFRRMYNG